MHLYFNGILIAASITVTDDVTNYFMNIHTNL